MRPRLVFASCAVLAWAACVAVLAHCGGATQSADSADSSTDGTAHGDAYAPPESGDGSCDDGDAGDSDGARVPYVLCPVSPPEAGAACGVPGESCEYGPSWWLECNHVLRCTQGAWQDWSGGEVCPSYDGGPACPATYAEALAIDGSAGCPAHDCQYPEGYCECGGPGCGGGGIHEPLPLYGLAWTCAPATSQCPSPRPHLGTACSGEAGCSYGWACGCGQQQQCVDGVWQGNPLPPCP
jgi:hypothetical protein